MRSSAFGASMRIAEQEPTNANRFLRSQGEQSDGDPRAVKQQTNAEGDFAWDRADGGACPQLVE